MNDGQRQQQRQEEASEDEEEEEEELPKENKTLRLLQEEYYQNQQKYKVINESPKVNLISHTENEPPVSKHSKYADWDKLTKPDTFISERESKEEIKIHQEDLLQQYISWESRPSIEEACTPTFFFTRRSSQSDWNLHHLQRELYGSVQSETEMEE